MKNLRKWEVCTWRNQSGRLAWVAEKIIQLGCSFQKFVDQQWMLETPPGFRCAAF